MIRSVPDDDVDAALGEHRRSLIVAYTSTLLVRSHRSELSAEEAFAVAHCTTLADAMRVVERRRKPISTDVVVVESDDERAHDRPAPFRDGLTPIVQVLRAIIRFIPIWVLPS